ncbi:hypothetical protein IW262DRAFT_1302743 [Armillaria fumosa]|nr:hypothetical protein IW262DRAFT_1302743 [Armillaria fumosa]
MVHWSTKNNGGDIHRSKDSPAVNGSKISNKQCLGILQCDNPDCSTGYHPQVTPHRHKQQLKGWCICGLELYISQATRHPDQVKYEHRQVKARMMAESGAWYLTQFSNWQYIHNHHEDPLNGLLSDVVHGYWAIGQYLLIVTSVFSDILEFWVPGLFMVSNSTLAEHYYYHFKGILESIAEVATMKKMEIHDKMFASVVNFSEPQ